jgi:hypothetical protein
MSTATDLQQQQPNKRTRFSDKAAPSSATYLSLHTAQPPKLLAESFIRSSIASLHPIIASNVEKLGKEHIILLSKKHHLDKAYQRLVNDTDLIPSSARFKFELSVTDKVKEMPEYKALHDKTIAIVQKAQQDLKIQIVAASGLERQAITNEIQRHLVKSIRLITSSFLLYYKNPINIDVAVFILINRYLDNLFIHVPMNEKDFITVYKQVHAIETFPPSIITTPTTTTTTPVNRNSTVSPFFSGGGSSAHSSSSSRFLQEETKEQESIPIPENIITIKELLENVFVSSWSRFLEQQSKNELSIELKKFSGLFSPQELHPKQHQSSMPNQPRIKRNFGHSYAWKQRMKQRIC